MTSAKVKDWAMCVAFWGCIALMASSFMTGSSCVREHEQPLLKQLMEKVWPR